MARERTEETHTQTLHTTPTEQKKNKSHDRPVETKVVLWERLTVDKQMFCQWSKLAEKKSGDSLIGMPTDKVETQRIRLPIECIFERHSTERKYKNLWAFFLSFCSLLWVFRLCLCDSAANFTQLKGRNGFLFAHVQVTITANLTLCGAFKWLNQMLLTEQNTRHLNLTEDIEKNEEDTHTKNASKITILSEHAERMMHENEEVNSNSKYWHIWLFEHVRHIKSELEMNGMKGNKQRDTRIYQKIHMFWKYGQKSKRLFNKLVRRMHLNWGRNRKIVCST